MSESLSRSAEAVGNIMDADHALRADGLCKGYDAPGGRLEVLRGVDLVVRRGTLVAIVGVSGSGKSTLLNLLGTLDRPDAGTLQIAGLQAENLGEDARARLRAERLGFVFQFHHLLPEFTAEENVMMPLLIAGRSLAEARSEAASALAAVGLAGRAGHAPDALAGGEAQRVAVARAIVSRPALVLADEPSGNLDAGHARGLHELLSSMAHERHQTVVTVTHDARLAASADEVWRLEDGRLVPERE